MAKRLQKCLPLTLVMPEEEGVEPEVIEVTCVSVQVEADVDAAQAEVQEALFIYTCRPYTHVDLPTLACQPYLRATVHKNRANSGNR